MIWIKSAFSGLLVMFVGSFLCLAVFLNHELARSSKTGETSGVGLPDLMRDPIALLIILGWFLAGSGLAFWYLRR